MTGVDYYNGFSSNIRGFDMLLMTTLTTTKSGSPTGLTHTWMVRPYVSSATFIDSSGTSHSKSTSTWTEIYRYTWIPTAIGNFTNDSNPLKTSDFVLHQTTLHGIMQQVVV